jgi:hypothetical protein
LGGDQARRCRVRYAFAFCPLLAAGHGGGSTLAIPQLLLCARWSSGPHDRRAPACASLRQRRCLRSHRWRARRRRCGAYMHRVPRVGPEWRFRWSSMVGASERPVCARSPRAACVGGLRLAIGQRHVLGTRRAIAGRAGRSRLARRPECVAGAPGCSGSQRMNDEISSAMLRADPCY